MSSTDGIPDFLPGDPNPPPERYAVPEAPAPPPRKNYPVPLLILGGVLVFLLLAGGFVALRLTLGDGPDRHTAGGASEPMPTLPPREGPPPALQKVRIGERAQVEGLYGKGSIVILSHEWATTGHLTPGEGKRYLNVQVRYDVSEGSMLLKPDYLAAYDGKHTEYLSGIGSGKPYLEPTELKKGKSATAWASFEMPPGQSFVVISDEAINPLMMVEIPGP